MTDIAVIDYAGIDYPTTVDLAAQTIALTRYAVDNNVSLFRYIVNSGTGEGVFLLLGPGIPIAIRTEGHESFLALVDQHSAAIVDQHATDVED